METALNKMLCSFFFTIKTCIYFQLLVGTISVKFKYLSFKNTYMLSFVIKPINTQKGKCSVYHWDIIIQCLVFSEELLT